MCGCNPKWQRHIEFPFSMSSEIYTLLWHYSFFLFCTDPCPHSRLLTVNNEKYKMSWYYRLEVVGGFSSSTKIKFWIPLKEWYSNIFVIANLEVGCNFLKYCTSCREACKALLRTPCTQQQGCKVIKITTPFTHNSTILGITWLVSPCDHPLKCYTD